MFVGFRDFTVLIIFWGDGRPRWEPSGALGASRALPKLGEEGSPSNSSPTTTKQSFCDCPTQKAWTFYKYKVLIFFPIKQAIFWELLMYFNFSRSSGKYLSILA